jgi:hypothetical protein
MSWNTWGRWGVTMLMVGCSSKLQVDTNPPSGGTGGGGGASIETGPEGGSLVPGNVGQHCVPSTTLTEAVGTIGQADVLELAHCADGLTCGSDGVCGAIPDCPQTTGICIVSRPNPNASGTGGVGGSGGSPSFGGDGQAVALPEAGVQGLAADESRVYWVEYGTRDSLGNYTNDGALKAYDGKTIMTLSSNLRGPLALGLTSSHVYVYLDGAPLLGTTLKRQLVRVPLAGGEPELIQDGVDPITFVGVGDRAFWGGLGTIYSVTADANASPAAFQTDVSYPTALTADATDIYYIDEEGLGTIESAPIAGGPPVSTGAHVIPFFVKGDSIYGFDGTDGQSDVVLDQVPKVGGTVQRVRALGAAGYRAVQVVGERYFWDQYTEGASAGELGILSASFDPSSPIVRVFRAPVPPSFASQRAAWVVTTTTVYWTDGSAIYSRSLADLP